MRAALPTLWTYSGMAPGGSNCRIVVTSGKSSPRAATSVHSRTASDSFWNDRNEAQRSPCCMFPCNLKIGTEVNPTPIQVGYTVEVMWWTKSTESHVLKKITIFACVPCLHLHGKNTLGLTTTRITRLAAERRFQFLLEGYKWKHHDYP